MRLPLAQRRAVFCYIAGSLGGTALDDYHSRHHYLAAIWMAASLVLFILNCPPRNSEKPAE